MNERAVYMIITWSITCLSTKFKMAYDRNRTWNSDLELLGTVDGKPKNSFPFSFWYCVHEFLRFQKDQLQILKNQKHQILDFWERANSELLKVIKLDTIILYLLSLMSGVMPNSPKFTWSVSWWRFGVGVYETCMLKFSCYGRSLRRRGCTLKW